MRSTRIHKCAFLPIPLVCNVWQSAWVGSSTGSIIKNSSLLVLIYPALANRRTFVVVVLNKRTFRFTPNLDALEATKALLRRKFDAAYDGFASQAVDQEVELL